MYFVHLNNPTRQVRVDANNISVIDGFVLFSIRAHPEDYSPATVAVFRAEDVATVYNQDNIQSVIALPNVGSGSRIPFETTQRVEPSADYAPAIIRQGNTATQARQYPPISSEPSSYPDPIAYPSGELLNTTTVGNSALAAWGDEDSPARVPAGLTYFADRIRRNPFMPTRLPAIPLPRTVERVLERGGYETADEVGPIIHAHSYPTPPPVATREPFRVSTDNMMATINGPSVYEAARAQAMSAGENF